MTSKLFEALTQAYEYDRKEQMPSCVYFHVRGGGDVKELGQFPTVLDGVMELARYIRTVPLDVEKGEFLFNENAHFNEAMIGVKWIIPARELPPSPGRAVPKPSSPQSSSEET